jgi:hypothetical protein
MAEPPTETVTAPTTMDAFLEDRRNFLHDFTLFTTGAVIVIATILVLMAIFLV